MQQFIRPIYYLLVTVIIGILLNACASSSEQAANKPWHHLSDGRYRNPEGSPQSSAGSFDMLRFFIRRMRDEPPLIPPGHAIDADAALAALAKFADVDSVTWLGHAAFLVRLDGKTILIDPYLSNVAGPFGFGPERYVPAGLSVAALPKIDIILISHNHYDHLDAKTIAALPNKATIHVVAPLGLGEFFRDRGYLSVHEQDWYDQVEIDGINVEVLPAIHFSRRGLFDRNRTLWCSFAIRSPKFALYHSGDTAYHKRIFREIGERSGPFDLALVAIGAYEPRSIMRTAHVTPEDAVRLIDEVRADRAIGMHWGTVRLTDESVFEPPARFTSAAAAANWPTGRAHLMRIGETAALVAPP